MLRAAAGFFDGGRDRRRPRPTAGDRSADGLFDLDLYGLDPRWRFAAAAPDGDPARHRDPRVAALADVPINSWSSADLRLMLGAFPGWIAPLKLALAMLDTDPLMAASDRPGDLLLAAAESATPPGIGNAAGRHLAPVREMLWRRQRAARAAFRRDLHEAAMAAGLDQDRRAALRQRLEDGRPVAADALFEAFARIAETLAEIGFTLMPPTVLFTASDRQTFAAAPGRRPVLLAGRDADSTASATRCFVGEISFAVIADGERVRLCHFSEAGAEAWNGPVFDTPLAAIAHAHATYGVPQTSWRRGGVR